MWYKFLWRKKICKQYFEKKNPATEKCLNRCLYMLSIQENKSIYPRQFFVGCIVLQCDGCWERFLDPLAIQLFHLVQRLHTLLPIEIGFPYDHLLLTMRWTYGGKKDSAAMLLYAGRRFLNIFDCNISIILFPHTFMMYTFLHFLRSKLIYEIIFIIFALWQSIYQLV